MTIIVYFSYYSSALRFLNKVRGKTSDMESNRKNIWDEINKQDLPISSELLQSLTMQQEESELRDYSLAAQICACMAVEAFLNLYGVNGIGEDFYQRNLERLSIAQKVEMLIALVKHEPVKKDDEILKITRRMFSKRNQLVHPKAREFASLDELNNSLKDQLGDVEDMVKDMLLFFDLFKLADPNSEDMINRIIESE